jgi:hypothetical protein
MINLNIWLQERNLNKIAFWILYISTIWSLQIYKLNCLRIFELQTILKINCNLGIRWIEGGHSKKTTAIWIIEVQNCNKLIWSIWIFDYKRGTWIQLHFQFGTLQLFEVCKYTSWILQRSWSYKQCRELILI